MAYIGMPLEHHGTYRALNAAKPWCIPFALGEKQSIGSAKGHRYRGTNAEIAFDGKLGIADGADVLHDGQAEARAADALGVGFVHAIEALA